MGIVVGGGVVAWLCVYYTTLLERLSRGKLAQWSRVHAGPILPEILMLPTLTREKEDFRGTYGFLRKKALV